jgi:hypothetical protein
LREYNKAYRRERRARLIEMLGGKCVRCGSTEGLQFDHIDPSTKRFAVGSSMSKAWDELVEEALKCQLLCRKITGRRAPRTVLSQLTAGIDTPTTAADAPSAGQLTLPRAPGCERNGLE